MAPLRILFISRAYPPVVGGIERQNFEISRRLARIAEVRLIANRRGKRFLPLFLPWALIRALWLAPRQDVVLLGDGVLGLIGWVLKHFTRTPVACILHGLDLTYPAPIYQQLWVKRWIPAADRLFPVSRATLEQAAARGIDEGRCQVIPNGVDADSFELAVPRHELERIIGRALPGRRLLLTVGRLVKRKGVAWFVDQVLPLLPADLLYLIVGEGPERDNIAASIERRGLQDRALLLGRLGQEDTRKLFGGVELFVQPNIPVAGDMEGFGLVVLEASAAGAPVVASRLEGLADAVVEPVNGLLVAPQSAEAFRDAIMGLLNDEPRRRAMADSARQLAATEFHWDAIAERYHRACAELARKKGE